jgi:ParB-like nuclease family protein
MTRNHYLSHRAPSSNNIRAWKYGELPMPDWVPQHIAGGIEPNGTFALETDLGYVRVHPGNIVIERCGTVWVRPVKEAANFMESLELTADPTITNIGPGKVRQFGTGGRPRGKATSNDRKANDRRPHYPPPVGSLPSIEWVHLNRLSIDSTYQRSTDNAASRRLIAGIAAKFDWRLCAPLVVSRRADDTLTIIDGQHRWMAVCRRDDIPQLPCCVFRYESTEEEARMFIVVVWFSISKPTIFG